MIRVSLEWELSSRRPLIRKLHANRFTFTGKFDLFGNKESERSKGLLNEICTL